VARNRKRAKDRRTRPSATEADRRQGLPTATHDFDNGAAKLEPDNGAAELEPVDLGSDAVEEDIGVDSLEDDDEGAPPPLEHATPDVELAEEQLAVGRPREPEPEDEADEEEFEREVEDSIADAGRGRGGPRRRRGGYDGESAGPLAVPGAAAVTQRRPSLIARLIGFLQGSWRELHRVQWPDRRQVMQATGVVIGFVIVAAVFLGVADEVSGKLVTFVLK
jgi:preprotein translocase subunit SecE